MIESHPDTPRFAHPLEHLVPVGDHFNRLMDIPPSRMFLIKKSLRIYLEKHPESPVYDASQGDGGASLPGVPAEILEAAARMQFDHGTAYDMPYGTDAYRRAVLGDYWQADSETGLTPQNIVGAAGGRDALVKAYAAMLALGYGRLGDLILVSRVPWISYNWGPYGIGANVLLAPGRDVEAWAYTEEGIRESARFAAQHNRKIAGMVITSPDNPTGRTLTLDDQARLARCALEAGVAYVLFDWMYHYITDEAPVDLNAFLRLFSPQERERLIIMDGITKSLGGSNIRSAHLIAPKPVADYIVARASHTVIPPFFALAVAQRAYEMGFARASAPIVEPTNRSRVVLREALERTGYSHILGQGYYAFIDVRPWLSRAGWADSEPLSEYLAADHGVAVVPGVYSSDEGAGWVRFSYAQTPEVTAAAFERFHTGLAALG